MRVSEYPVHLSIVYADFRAASFFRNEDFVASPGRVALPYHSKPKDLRDLSLENLAFARRIKGDRRGTEIGEISPVTMQCSVCVVGGPYV